MQNFALPEWKEKSSSSTSVRGSRKGLAGFFFFISSATFRISPGSTSPITSCYSSSADVPKQPVEQSGKQIDTENNLQTDATTWTRTTATSTTAVRQTIGLILGTVQPKPKRRDTFRQFISSDASDLQPMFRTKSTFRCFLMSWNQVEQTPAARRTVYVPPTIDD